MNTEAINGKLQVGDIVLVNSNEDYGCLVGTVTAINKVDTPEHETDNETDDVHVDFQHSEYSDSRKLEIEKHFEGLTGNSVPFDMLPLDDVIMPPGSLIRVTDLSRKGFTEILSGFDNAKDYGESLQRDYFDSLEQTLIERVEQNYSDYNNSLLSFGQRQLIDMAATIHAYSDCWSYLTDYGALSGAEVKFLSQFDNPLEIVAEQWHKRNIDVSDVSFTLDFIMEPERQKSTLEAYPLYNEKPVADVKITMTREVALTPRQRLEEKMEKEYGAFIWQTERKAAREIIESSYQKVFMEDILLTVKNGDLSDEQIDALLSLDTPLADLYWNWLDTDASYMDMLRDCVEEYADKAIGERRETEQAKQESKQEPIQPKQQQHPAPKQPDTLLKKKGDVLSNEAELENENESTLSEHESISNFSSEAPSTQVINGEVACYDTVIAVGNSDYPYFVGEVNAVDKIGTWDHHSGSDTDDVFVNFQSDEYSATREQEIVDFLNNKNGTSKSFDEWRKEIFNVRMSPNTLIATAEKDMKALLDCREIAESYCNAVLNGETDLEVALTARVEQNNADYRKSLTVKCSLLDEVREAAREVEARKAVQPAQTKSTKKEMETL